MIVLDTHVWVWWTTGSKPLSRRAQEAISKSETLGVSAMSALELATLVRKKRIILDKPVDEWVRAALALPKVEELPVTAEIAVRAGSFGDEFHGDPGDRVIAATALRLGAPLVTKDELLRAIPTLGTIW